MVEWLMIFYEESVESDIGKMSEGDRIQYKWWTRCNHLCEKFGLRHPLNLIWLRNFSKEGMSMQGMEYDRNVWNKVNVERIKEYGRK